VQGIAQLRDLCVRLDEDPTALSTLFGVLSAEGSGGDGGAAVSVFELLHSGAVRQLNAYLQALDVADGGWASACGGARVCVHVSMCERAVEGVCLCMLLCVV